MPFWLFLILLPIWFVVYLWMQRRSHSDSSSPPQASYALLDVMHNGVAIAQITNPKYADMFWETFDIVPLSDEGRKLIETNELWDSCQFYFRDPKTGKECRGAFAAGPAPFVNENKVTLRGLYTWTSPSGV